MDDSLQSRGKAIEDLFFAQQDQALIDKLKAEMESKENREALASASGIDDAEVLDGLMAAGITPESLTSVSLIPLIEVAWADKKMEDSEKVAILQAAEKAGIAQGTPSYELLSSWLEKKPDPELLETWKAYIGSLKATLETAAVNQLKNSILGRAEGVAQSAGGFLGLGNKVSDVEQKVLDDLASAF